jgi:hypothetical protein
VSPSLSSLPVPSLPLLFLAAVVATPRTAAASPAIAFTNTVTAIAMTPPVFLPPVNLGGSSFMDALGRPGILVHESFAVTDAQHFTGPEGQTLPGQNSLLAVATLTHLAFSLPQEILGGHWGAEVLLPLGYVHVHTFASDGSARGLGDLIVSPLVFQFPELRVFERPLFQRLDFDFVLPTGQYRQDASVSVGNHLFSFNPYYAFTLLLTDRLETSWRIHYLWNSANTAPPVAYQAGRIQPGQAMHFNGAVSYALWPEFRIGVAGYYLKEVTNSTIDGRSLVGSRERVGALGPGFSISHQSFRTVVNGYLEFAGQNRPEGGRLSVSFYYAW